MHAMTVGGLDLVLDFKSPDGYFLSYVGALPADEVELGLWGLNLLFKDHVLKYFSDSTVPDPELAVFEMAVEYFAATKVKPDPSRYSKSPSPLSSDDKEEGKGAFKVF